MKIAILGFAREGRSAYEYWDTPENEITVCDANEALEVPQDAQAVLGNSYLHNLGSFDMVVRTPSLHPKDIVAANSPEIFDKVWSNTNEFLKVCPTKNVIGVTGTKGKGTTSTLISKMLEAAGKRVHLGGNIGLPPLELLKNNIQPDDWVVLELSSFQLIDLKSSPHIAVCLMIASEHMDWHEDMEEYVAAKQQLFMQQTEQDIAIYYANGDDSLSIADASEGTLIPYYEKPGAVVENNAIVIDSHQLCQTDELKLLGKHNWQNVCAAVTTVWSPMVSEVKPQLLIEAIRSVLTTFTGLEHRLQFVRELNGVVYYDDSFGTTPETAIVAIEAFTRPKVIILGGSDKGSNYKTLVETVVSNDVRTVVAIGQTGTVIADQLRKSGFTKVVNGGKTMPEIVEAAKNAAQSGDVVLLSAACASFDLFDNYKQRGELFTQAVRSL